MPQTPMYEQAELQRMLQEIRAQQRRVLGLQLRVRTLQHLDRPRVTLRLRPRRLCSRAPWAGAPARQAERPAHHGPRCADAPAAAPNQVTSRDLCLHLCGIALILSGLMSEIREYSGT